MAASCERGGGGADDDTADVEMELEITPNPPVIGPAEVTILLTDENGDPIDGADLEIEGDMSHAGMQPVIVHADGVQAGRYTSDGFEFTMGGDWFITVSGALPDGRLIERTFDVTGVAS